MAFLYEHRENDQRALSKPHPSQMSLRSSGDLCHKSHATSPPAQSIPRWPHLGAGYPAPIEPPATRRCERFIEPPISAREIARRLDMSRQTVQKFLVAESFPERSTPPYRGSILDPYKPSILDRWKAGCWNGSQLYTEVKALGYTGSEALFRLFISSVRKQHQATGTSEKLELSAHGAKVSGPIDPASKPSIKRRLSPTRAAWLYVSQAVKLDEKQRQQVAHIRAAHDDLDLAYELTQAFVSMLAEIKIRPWITGLHKPNTARLRCRARHVHFTMEQRSS